jgi:transcriptional regulator with XRE-family HTH domain
VTKTVQRAFGEQVRQLRKARGWSQEELGEHAGKHWTYIGGIERGERNPTLLVIADLAKAFGVPIRELFFSDSRSAT